MAGLSASLLRACEVEEVVGVPRDDARRPRGARSRCELDRRRSRLALAHRVLRELAAFPFTSNTHWRDQGERSNDIVIPLKACWDIVLKQMRDSSSHFYPCAKETIVARTLQY